MANRKKESEDRGNIVFLIFLIFVTLIIVITPVVLLWGWLKNLFIYNRNYRHKLKRCFWLDDKQKENFKILANNLDYAIAEVKRANVIGDNEGLVRNNDGQFSARSYRGKEIREIINKYQALIFEQQPMFEELQNLPMTDWKNCKKYYSKAIGFGVSIFAWLFSTYRYAEKNFATVSEGLQDYFSFPFKILSKVFGSKEDVPLHIDSMLEIVLISLLFLGIGRVVGAIIMRTRCRKPSLVNLDNVDSK